MQFLYYKISHKFDLLHSKKSKMARCFQERCTFKMTNLHILLQIINGAKLNVVIGQNKKNIKCEATRRPGPAMGKKL